MPLECPRCLLTNPDTVLMCECGYDFTPHFQRMPFHRGNAKAKSRRPLFKRQMLKSSFVFGVILIWLALSTGELYRIRIELPRRPILELAISSLMVGLTDLIGALVIGTIGWACVWIAMSSHGRPAQLCPRRTTFVVTLFASAVLFVIRTVEPTVLIQHIAAGLAIVALAAFSYYAGSRQWLGKW
jgi:uncharacterized membrane protein